MFSLVISIFTIFQCQNLVSTNDVVEWTPTSPGYQIQFPWLKTEQLDKTVSWETLSPKGQVYKVECNVYQSTNPRADIFTKDGILVDSVFLDTIDSTSCDEGKLKNYIIPQDPENGLIRMIYLWSNREGTCVERKYKVQTWSFLASVKRFDYPKVDCPDAVKQFLSGFDTSNNNDKNKPKPGGVVTLLLVGEAQFMDYTEKLKTAGQPKTLYFPEKDIEGKQFKLICREDLTTPGIKIRTGSIIYTDNRGEDIVLEKFKLKSCSTEYININRQIHYIKDCFKTVFKTDRGTCYERQYTKMNVNLLHYYDETTIDRMKPVKVTCPASFKGDINMNAYQPYYYYIYSWLFPTTPFSIDLRTPQQKEESRKQ